MVEGFRLFLLAVPKELTVKVLYFRSRPGGAAEEVEAGFDAGIVVEAADGDAASHFFPAVVFGEACQDHFEGDAVQGVWGGGFGGHAGRGCFIRFGFLRQEKRVMRRSIRLGGMKGVLLI